MSMKNLLTTWSLPDRAADRAQITLRLAFTEYAKLHALKEIYPNRSVNDMIGDILKNGLDEIIDSLPTYKIDHEEAAELAHYQGGKVDDYRDVLTGPGIAFKHAYSTILNSKSDTDSQGEVA